MVKDKVSVKVKGVFKINEVQGVGGDGGSVHLSKGRAVVDIEVVVGGVPDDVAFGGAGDGGRSARVCRKVEPYIISVGGGVDPGSRKDISVGLDSKEVA